MVVFAVFLLTLGGWLRINLNVQMNSKSQFMEIKIALAKFNLLAVLIFFTTACSDNTDEKKPDPRDTWIGVWGGSISCKEYIYDCYSGSQKCFSESVEITISKGGFIYRNPDKSDSLKFSCNKAIPNLYGVAKLLNNQVGIIAQSATIVTMPCWTAQLNADRTITLNANTMFCDKNSFNKPCSEWKIILSKL